jgi:hypothetical protein
VMSFAAIALVMAVGLLVTYLVGIIAALGGATIAGVSTAGLTDAATLAGLPEKFVRTWVALVEEGAIGFAIATIARSQLAGIGAGIGFYFVGTFAGIFLPDVVKYFPFGAANAAVSTGEAGLGSGGDQFPALDPNTALLVVGLWLVGSLLVAALFTERSEITG